MTDRVREHIDRKFLTGSGHDVFYKFDRVQGLVWRCKHCQWTEQADGEPSDHECNDEPS